MTSRLVRSFVVASFIAAIGALAPSTARAVKVGIGPSVGQVYSTMSGEVGSRTTWRGGPTIGGVLRVEFPQVVGFETGVGYSLMGTALAGDERGRQRTMLDFHKLAVPALVQVRLSEFRLVPRLIGGATVNFVGIACLEETCRADPFEAVHLGWTVGAGVDLPLPVGGLTLQGRFEQTRLRVSPGANLPGPFEASVYGLSGIVVEIGLLF